VKAFSCAFALAVGAALAWSNSAFAEDLILQLPDYDHFNASALDQPEMAAVLTYNGEVITEGGEPVIIEVFADTGASGSVISYLNAVGYDYEPIAGLGYVHVPSLGLDGAPAGEFAGYYTEIGFGGQETGDVTRPLGVKILNGPMGSSSDPNDFIDYGQHNLWVRRDVGMGEVISVDIITLVDPVNVVGMPIIQQRVMAMDPTPMAEGGRIVTSLLPPGDPGIPQTNVTLELALRDMVGEPPPGEMLPSHYDNALVGNVTIEHTSGAGTNTVSGNDWVFDTGSGSTFLSFAKAQAVGLIDSSYASLEDYMPHHVGLTAGVGGIGPGAVTVPILQLDEIRIPAGENFYVVWRNVAVMVIDIDVPVEGGMTLDGVMGLNLLVPSVTVDPADPLAAFDDISPGYFDSIVFDATDDGAVELRLFCELAPEAVLTGDMDGSGAINNNDVVPFILALTDGDEYFAQFGQHPELVGDIDGDGTLNNNDIIPFIHLMTTPVLTGDMDGSGAVNNNDVAPFVMALTDGDGYLAQFGLRPELVGDIDGDGALNNNDIIPFIHLLTGGQSVPEPTAIAILSLGAAALLFGGRASRGP